MLESILARKASYGFFNDDLYYDFDLNNEKLLTLDYLGKKYVYNLDNLKEIIEKENHDKQFFKYLNGLINGN
jgi:hypothetical protein